MSDFWELFDVVVASIANGWRSWDSEDWRDGGAPKVLALIHELRTISRFSNITNAQVEMVARLATQQGEDYTSLISAEASRSAPPFGANTSFCRDCANWAFARWRGWHPTKRAAQSESLPDLPLMIGGRCEICGGSALLAPQHVFYCNYHGPYNTGLPNYFYLIINETEVVPGIPAIRDLAPPYMLEGVARLPLLALAHKETLASEWNFVHRRIETRRSETELREAAQREAAAIRQKEAEVHADAHKSESQRMRDQRAFLIVKFEELSEAERAKALITAWPISLHAYPVEDLPIRDGLCLLNEGERELLSARLKGFNGPWRDVLKALSAKD